MKKCFKLFLAATLLAGVFTACGPEDKPVPTPIEQTLELTAEPNTIDANGSDAAQFTAKLNGEVVEATIIAVDGEQPLIDATFTTTEAGEYKFYATYDDPESDSANIIKSNEITIVAKTVEQADFDATKEVKKSVAFFTWTATWCGPCYTYKRSLNDMVNQFGDKMVLLNLYTDTSSNEAIGSPSSVRSTMTQLLRDGRFSVAGWPTSIAELRDDFATPGYVPTAAQARATYNKYIGDSPKTAVKVNSKIEDDKINVTVTVGAREADDYSIGIFLSEDHIYEYQNGGGNNYDHTNVAREIGAADIFGDSLGAMTEGQTIDKEFSFDVSLEYNTENLNLVIYTLYEMDGHNIIDNSIKVPVNVSTDFNYVE